MEPEEEREKKVPDEEIWDRDGKASSPSADTQKLTFIEERERRAPEGGREERGRKGSSPTTDIQKPTLSMEPEEKEGRRLILSATPYTQNLTFIEERERRSPEGEREKRERKGSSPTTDIQNPTLAMEPEEREERPRRVSSPTPYTQKPTLYSIMEAQHEEKPEDRQNQSPNPSSPVINAIMNRSSRDDLPVMMKAQSVSGDIMGPSIDGHRGASPVVSGIIRRSKRGKILNKAAFGLRVFAATISLISLSVMASDKQSGWSGDSFFRYKALRYCLSMSVITFIYSSFQVFRQVHQFATRRDFIKPPISYYFDFSMDQILAYLLISSSSAAASFTDDMQSYWGKDPFTTLAGASVAMAFLAFAALGLSSLVSAFYLFNRYH
ncbi:hypothetical protein AMTRI_Chr01g112690 [Amborella trichopoda]|uniref:CASP-like protein n=1 Tax=Amborella trichopoda TaxID=13333 RepID=W1PG87_AMBTC|nr:CASP-like protein 4A3 [Amborella trichopoda]ERN06646.1 hypothetical protein AMTR_s00058p00182510 [Amborella trichopoda]|eukprot:XP_006844971.1 CASP-like protein 4A3 [Amborella trichopoda]